LRQSMHDQITVEELKEKLDKNEPLYLLDVRRLEEWQQFRLCDNLIPLAQLNHRLEEVPENLPIVVYCRSGCRSNTAMMLLKAAGFKDVKNLIGGVLAWQQKFGATTI